MKFDWKDLNEKKILLFLLIIAIILLCITYLFYEPSDSNFPNGYYFDLVSAENRALRGNNYVPPHIYKVGFNDKYIVVLQNPISAYNEEYYPNCDCFNYKKRCISECLDADHSVKKYYIIILENNEKIGPLSEEEYYKSEYTDIKLINASYYDEKWF